MFDLFFRRRLNLSGQEKNRAQIKFKTTILETAKAYREIRISGFPEAFFNHIELLSTRVVNIDNFTRLVRLLPSYLGETFVGLMFLGIVVWLVLSKAPLVEMIPLLTMFGIAGVRVVPGISSLVVGVAQLRHLGPSVTLLYEECTRVPNICDQKRAVSSKGHDTFESLSVKDLAFRYRKDHPWILEGASLDVRRGEMIGITGTSGMGKTTLIDLLLGLLHPQAGNITFNGKHTENLFESWNYNVYYVPQLFFLFDDTVELNVVFSREAKNVNVQGLRKALDLAEMWSFVKGLPKGERTKIGESGVRFSGGQRQRLALARAFYSERQVLVLDEAMSTLDVKTEQKIIDNMTKSLISNTIIMISHRQSVLARCDRVYAIENGKIITKIYRQNPAITDPNGDY